jgi:WD40 repeat protein
MQEPLWELKEHAQDIIDVCWHSNSHKIISTSFDEKVILWNLDIDKKVADVKPAYIYEHPDVASSICFFPKLNENLFVSGALDCNLRVWNTHKKST